MARAPDATGDAMPPRLILELKDALSRLLVGGVCQFYGLVCAGRSFVHEFTLLLEAYFVHKVLFRPAAVLQSNSNNGNYLVLTALNE